MQHAQKHAIIVMIESIEHQLSAVRNLINLSTDGAPMQRSVVKPAVEPREDVGYLSESEEDELESLLRVDEAAVKGKEQLLADLMGAANVETED